MPSATPNIQGITVSPRYLWENKGSLQKNPRYGGFKADLMDSLVIRPSESKKLNCKISVGSSPLANRVAIVIIVT
ncbi:hypothetical protein YQE_08840, partial [Dendroctonus ponderosae]